MFSGLNTLPVLSINADVKERALTASQILATLNSIAFDYIARQKVPGIHFTWLVMKQLPIIPLDAVRDTLFGDKSVQQIIRDIDLELTYTSNNMAGFAKDIGYVDSYGEVKKPFEWDEERRLRLTANLDAIFFHLYGYFDTEDFAISRANESYIYSTFPIS